MHSANEEDDIFEQDTEEWMEKKRAEHIRELRAKLGEAKGLLGRFADASRSYAGSDYAGDDYCDEMQTIKVGDLRAAARFLA